jgi:hypothetical protein
MIVRSVTKGNMKIVKQDCITAVLGIIKEWGVLIKSITTFKPQADTCIGEGTADRQVSRDGIEILASGGNQEVLIEET